MARYKSPKFKSLPPDKWKEAYEQDALFANVVKGIAANTTDFVCTVADQLLKRR